MNLPKVLTLDIETSLMKVYIYRLGEQKIGVDQVLEDMHILCFSAKWLHKPGIIYKETRNKDDKQVVKTLWRLLDEADIVITQNGESFDAPIIEARMMVHRMLPPSPYKHLDTYRATKPRGFISHKLSYLTSILNAKYQKQTHSAFPGMSLWIECDKGNPKAWKIMKEYNIHDVYSTEELYQRIKPWIRKGLPSADVPVEAAVKCSTCHSYAVRSLGIRKTGKFKYRRFVCTQCGHCTNGDKYAS